MGLVFFNVHPVIIECYWVFKWFGNPSIVGPFFKYYETWPPVDLKLILDGPPGSKVRYPDLVRSTSRATLAVLTSGYCLKFQSPPSGTRPTSPSRSTLDVTIYGA